MTIPPRTHNGLRRIGKWTWILGLGYWAASLCLFQARYDGDLLSVCMRDGYFAAYWGGDWCSRALDEYQCETWPILRQATWTTQFSSIAVERGWHLRGPAQLLSRYQLQRIAAEPQRLGFFLPATGVCVWGKIRYLGIPMWPLVTVGGMLHAYAALKTRRHDAAHCSRCGYSLTGLAADAVCPECGTSHADSDRVASDSAARNIA